MIRLHLNNKGIMINLLRSNRNIMISLFRKNKNIIIIHQNNNKVMEAYEMREAIRDKNSLLILQTRRIALLEEKMDELRVRYFKLKYGYENGHLYMKIR